MARKAGSKVIGPDDVQYVVQELMDAQAATVTIKLDQWPHFTFVELEVWWEPINAWQCPAQKMKYRVLNKDYAKMQDGLYKRLWACLGLYNREILIQGRDGPVDLSGRFLE